MKNRIFLFFLYFKGFRTIQSLRENYHENLTKKLKSDLDRIKYGLTYYDDLAIRRINQSECKYIFEFIKDLILTNIDKDCIIELTGGFRRGKPTGHDVDILITHPNSGKEKEILTKCIELLEDKGVVIHGKHDRESNHDWTKPNSKNYKMDHFERFISILKFPSNDTEEEPSSKSKKPKLDDSLDSIINSLDASKFNRNWIARRVDLIICSIDQFPFALLGSFVFIIAFI